MKGRMAKVDWHLSLMDMNAFQKTSISILQLDDEFVYKNA